MLKSPFFSVITVGITGAFPFVKLKSRKKAMIELNNVPKATYLIFFTLFPESTRL